MDIETILLHCDQAPRFSQVCRQWRDAWFNVRVEWFRLRGMRWTEHLIWDNKQRPFHGRKIDLGAVWLLVRLYCRGHETDYIRCHLDRDFIEHIINLGPQQMCRKCIFGDHLKIYYTNAHGRWEEISYQLDWPRTHYNYSIKSKKFEKRGQLIYMNGYLIQAPRAHEWPASLSATHRRRRRKYGHLMAPFKALPDWMFRNEQLAIFQQVRESL